MPHAKFGLDPLKTVVVLRNKEQTDRQTHRTYSVIYPRESEGICFTGVALCVCVCLSLTTITKKIADGFVPNFWEGS